MRKVIVWGIGNEYEAIVNQIKFEILKGNMVVEALVSRDIVTPYFDGFPVIHKEQLNQIKFDYCVISSAPLYEQIKEEGVNAGIPKDRLINGKVFKLPDFDFKKYINLVENPVTILSDDCWGGYVYNLLGLQFNSPTINIAWRKDSYIRFVKNLDYCLEQPLLMLREGNLRNNEYPIGILRGREAEEIVVDFVHCASFEEAKRQWDRRKARVNRNKLFVKIGFDVCDEKSDEYLKQFEMFGAPKICFYSGETDVDHVVFLDRFLWKQKQDMKIGKRMDFISYNDFCRNMKVMQKSVSLLALLNGEKEYLRESKQRCRDYNKR